MSSAVMAVEDPPKKNNTRKAILSFLNHPLLLVIFALFCLGYGIAGEANCKGPRAGMWFGGLFGLIASSITVIPSLIVCHIIKKNHKPRYKYETIHPFGEMVENAWGWWIFLTPALLVNLTFAYIVYPDLKKETTLVINQQKVDSWTFANPFNQEVLFIKKGWPMYSVTAYAKTKDEVFVRGSVEADFLLADQPRHWLTNDQVQAEAEMALQSKFEKAIAKMNASDLGKEIMIEINMLDPDLPDILKWKPRSVIKVTGVHPVAPES